MWSSETVYHGADLDAQVPPEGGTPTAALTNARGRTVEKRQNVPWKLKGLTPSQIDDLARNAGLEVFRAR